MLAPCLLLGLIAGWLAYLPHQTIPHDETIDYYDVDALSYQALKQQLLDRGPGEFMAWTEWYVSVSWICQVSVRTRILLPRHTRPEGMNTRQRQNWTAFMTKLRLHERAHQYHGLQAAREVAENRCIGAVSIIRSWVEADDLFDVQTDHGRAEGLVLRF